METTESNWTLGEVTTLPRKERLLKKSSRKSYSRYIGSRYVCIREATNEQRGILMKVLGKANSDKIMMVGSEPFCKDDREELFFGVHYLSYTFPKANEVTEALNIIRANQNLKQQFEEVSMHINPDSTFWVSDTTRNMLLVRKPQYLDGRNGQLYTARDNGEHYRVTFVYFYKDNLNW